MSRKRLDRIGEINESNNHGTMKINKYHNARNIEVKFKNTGNITKTTYSAFRCGNVTDSIGWKSRRTGQIQESNKYGLMEIVEYNRASDIKVKFINTGAIVTSTYRRFDEDCIKDPLHKEVCGVGCFGIGNHQDPVIYTMWSNMVHRCYNPYTMNKNQNLGYINVHICKEWLIFQEYCSWYIDNYYSIPGEIMTMDKDIILKNNKTYSPKFCCIVPNSINLLMITKSRSRGKYPIGVYSNQNSNGYTALLCIDGKQNFLGNYNTPEKAFNVYKIAKENNIKRMADKYKEWLPQNVYETLYNYQVEITD